MSSIGDIMMIRSPSDLGVAIRDRRKQLGLDQRTLARRAGVSRQWIVEVEQGKTRAAIGLLLQTIRALDLELEMTVSGAGPSARPRKTVDLDALIERAKRSKKGALGDGRHAPVPARWPAGWNDRALITAGAAPAVRPRMARVPRVVGVPSGRAPTTHILKPPELAGHAENEHTCIALARALGLPSAHSEVRRFGGEVAIVVERFDRVQDDRGRWSRVHQEDVCQALGILPSAKYQSSR